MRHACAGGIMHQRLAVPAHVHTVLSGVFGCCTLVTDMPLCVAFAFGYCFAVLKSTVD